MDQGRWRMVERPWLSTAGRIVDYRVSSTVDRDTDWGTDTAPEEGMDGGSLANQFCGEPRSKRGRHWTYSG